MIEARGGIGHKLQFQYDEKLKEVVRTPKNFLVSVCDLYIFDEKENLVLQSDTLIDCTIKIGDDHGVIKFADAVFSLDLLKFANNQESDKEKTDYQKVLNTIESTHIVLKNKRKNRICKVVAIGKVKKQTGEIFGYLKYCFPHCEIDVQHDRYFVSNGVCTDDGSIRILPDEQDNLAEIVLSSTKP
jgi:hypothetical protein